MLASQLGDIDWRFWSTVRVAALSRLPDV
jgi:hypothetical protein